MSGPQAEARFVSETGAAAGIAAIIEPVLESLGYRLVLVRILQGQGTIVEIMAERPDGSMTIEDCRAVSLGLSPVLDVHDPVASSYRLQVSSPGIDRPLVRASDFDHWSGFEARIELKELVDGRRRFRGILEGFEEGEVRIEVDLGPEKGGVQVLGLPLALVDEAKLMLTDDLIRESLRRTKRELAALAAGDEVDPAQLEGVEPAEPEEAQDGGPAAGGQAAAAGKRKGPARDTARADKARAGKAGAGKAGADKARAEKARAEKARAEKPGKARPLQGRGRNSTRRSAE